MRSIVLHLRDVQTNTILMKIISRINLSPTVSLQSLKRYNDHLCIATQNTKLIINKTDILYLKSSSNYCEIHLHNGTSHLCSKTLKEIFSRLRNPDFIKVHSSYVINSKGLKSIDTGFNFLQLLDNTEIPVSRSRKASLKDLVNMRFD